MTRWKHIFLSFALLFFSSDAMADAYKEVRLFIDADKTFVTNAGGESEAVTAIQEIIASTDAIFRSQLGLTITIAGMHLWDSTDPFNRTTQSTLLASFAAYGESTYRGSYTYDVAHLFVGSGLGGEGGIAYGGSACGTVATAPYAYSLSQPDLTDTYEFNPHLVAHEVGHTLNAEHDAMPSCAKKTIMCEAQIGGSYSDDSVSQITSYVASRESSGCFASVNKDNPVNAVRLALSPSRSTLRYTVTGGQQCTSLTIVSSPSIAGLTTMFGYLQVGKLTPAATVTASSRNVLGLRGTAKVHVGVYCDGQLAAASVKRFKANRLVTRRVTTSAVLVIRSMVSGFRAS